MAGQKFPEVGLRAVFELSGFIKDWRKYQTLMGDIDRTTKQTAQKVTRSGQQMTANTARSFSEFARQSSIVRDAMDNMSPQASLAELQRLGEAFQDLGPRARVNVALFDQLANAGVGFADAMRVAGGQVQFNLPLFESLLQRGRDVEQAFQIASSGASGLGQTVSILGRTFTTTALAIGGATLALRTGIAVVRASIESYEELSEATRTVRLQTGLLTEEASAWVNVSQIAGVSTATSERALTSFLSKVADLRREQLAGEESTSSFAQAIATLGISVTDAEGNLRSTEELLADVNRAFQDLGPGIVSAQLATDLFGYSGRFLLPLLTDQQKSLADLEQEAQNLGATLTSLDKEAYAELREANNRLKVSFQGVRNEIARGWIRTKTIVVNALADILNAFRQVDAHMRAFSATANAMISGQVALANATSYYAEQLKFYLGIEDEAARAAEQAAQDRSNAAQETAARVEAAERKIREERRKTMEQFGELRTRYAERLDDIERDFERRWEDILVNRQRDAIERAIRLTWRYEDLARSAERSRQRALRDAADREADIRRDTQRRIEDAERDARQKREDLERTHLQRLADIRQRYLDTVTEAARDNDAVSVARAMRRRAREVRDEQTRYQREQQDLEQSLARKRASIERDRQEREKDHRRELARTLQRIEENYQEQREALALQTERERILREQRYRWEKEDFDKAKARQLADARAWYEKERAELAKHLDMTGEMLERAYTEWAEGTAAAVSKALSVASKRIYDEVSRYRHYISKSLGVIGGGRFITSRSTSRPRGGSRVPGAPRFGTSPGFAEGGVMHATRATSVLMGEGGGETAVFLPDSSLSTMNVNHNFGRLGVDFAGIPGGMSTQQVQAIVYAVVTQLVKGVTVR